MSFSSGRLLILDDDPDLGETIAAMGERAGLDCRAVSSADSFFEALDEWRPTHIALDLMMPGTDGIEILQRLAAIDCRARIIITSGAESRILDAAFRSGLQHGLDIAGVIAKPFSIGALRELLVQAAVSETREPAAPKAPQVVPPAPLLAHDIELALSRGEIVAAYQPKVSCHTGSLEGFEGLVRWHHPERGTIMPDQFVPVAESTALIGSLTLHVVALGLDWLARYFAGGELSLSFNLSARSLSDPELPDLLAAECERRGIAPARVVFELTETGAMTDDAVALDVLTRLRLKGFHLSIDDFGVGYSSLVQLARLPFSELKIDKSFVMSSLHSQESRAIIVAIIALARSLKLRTVAEGVEDLAVFNFLKQQGCDLAQGYFIGRPMEEAAITSWLGEAQAEPT